MRQYQICRNVMIHSVILGLLSVLQSKMSLLHILSECVAELDMLTAFATYSSKGSTRMVQPTIINFETGMISMTQSKHPILEHLGATSRPPSMHQVGPHFEDPEPLRWRRIADPKRFQMISSFGSRVGRTTVCRRNSLSTV